MRHITLILAALALALAAPAIADKGGVPNGGGNGAENADKGGVPNGGGNGGENGNKGGNGGGGNGGAGGGSASYTVTVDPSGPYYFGQAVYVTTDAPMSPDNTGPWISMECYQDGVKVGGADHAGFPGGWYYGDPFYLGPSQVWTGGAADCTVDVYHQENKRIVMDATTSFHVEP